MRAESIQIVSCLSTVHLRDYRCDHPHHVLDLIPSASFPLDLTAYDYNAIKIAAREAERRAEIPTQNRVAAADIHKRMPGKVP